MSKIVFSKCLNKEEKLYNCSVVGLMLGVMFLILGGIVFGMLFGFAAATFGFIIGTWFSSKWHQGFIQRKAYRALPYCKYWLDKRCPESSSINEL